MKANSVPKRKPDYWTRLSQKEREEWLELVGEKKKPAIPSLNETIIGLTLCALAILAMAFLFGDFESERTANAPVEEASQNGHSPGKREAYAAMQEILLTQLKSPSSAAFQSAWDLPMQKTDNTYRARFWVDAQNGFGATIREYYTMQLRYESGRWTLEEQDPLPLEFR